jgi:hypothetical protein
MPEMVEVPVSILCPEAGNPQLYGACLQTFPKIKIIPENRPRPLSSISFSIHHYTLT